MSSKRSVAAHEVTTEEGDNRQLLPMGIKARKVLGTESLNVVADAGYSNGEQARACEARGLVAHVPAHRAVNTQGDGTLRLRFTKRAGRVLGTPLHVRQQ